jgi:hypothetical protein
MFHRQRQKEGLFVAACDLSGSDAGYKPPLTLFNAAVGDGERDVLVRGAGGTYPHLAGARRDADS